MCPKMVLILFQLLLQFAPSKSESLCDPITQPFYEKTLVWDVHLTDNLYRSTPLCLDENFKIIHRSCEENVWTEEPICNSLQEERNPCPENFAYFKQEDICYTILKDQPFPPQCPYGNVVGFFDYIEIFATGLIKDPVWFPAKTVQDYGIGNMVIIEPTKYYGDLVSVSSFWKEIFNKNCLIYQSGLSFLPVYCNATYDHVCAYKPLRIRENNVCSLKLKKECAPSEFNHSEANCFCKQEEGSCSNNTIAEFLKPYQNILMGNCSIGLYHNDGKAMWSNTQEEITYSNWNKNVNFENTFGVILEDGTWSLEKEESPTCSICQENIVYNTPKIILKQDKEKKRLVLTVNHIEDLYLPEGRQVPIFCFSDTDSYINTFAIDNYADFEKIDENKTVYYFQYSESCPGYYWCEAFELPTFRKLKTGKVLVFDEEYYGNEYAAILVMEFQSMESMIAAMQKALTKIVEEDDPFYLRWLTTLSLNEESNTVEFLVHVTSKSFKDVQIEYFEFYDKLQTTISEIADFITMTDLRSVSYCLPDNTTCGDTILHWPLTKVNATTTPDEFCLQEDGTPVIRACTGDFLYGAKWMTVNGTCAKNPVISPITTSLYDLLHTNVTVNDKINNLAVMTGNVSNYLPVDIHYIAEIIDKADKQQASYLEDFTKVIDNVVSTQKITLKTSQDLLNSTDKLLYSFDVLVENFYNKKRMYSDTDIVTKNIMVYIFDAKVSNTSGIAVYNNSDNGYVVKKLHKNATIESLLEEENLKVATYIPEALLQQISENLVKNQSLVVAITVFLNDYLFNQDHQDTKEVVGNIFGILLPKIKDGFQVRIPIIYKSVENAIEKQCSYWHYGSPSEFANIKGKWELDDKPKEREKGDVCMFDHTTHFALLIFSDSCLDNDYELMHNYHYLNVITTMGCALSIFGILGILVTAILFKPWRSSKGNQILIQYSIVTLLQICLLYAASNIDHEENYVLCVVIGACLHYDVLSQFCWMLVMAILHYQRFVLVFNQQNKWILIKSSIVGYIFPAIPVLINICVSTDNYTVGTTGICYPTGAALYAWLLVPVGCIVLTNLSFFCIIIKNIFNRHIHDDYKQDYIFVLKLRLVVVLFSTLGITWIFGFAAEIFNSILFTYLFCLTASLQGFIIFLAFIVFNATTRRMYWFFMKTMKLRIKMIGK